MAFTTTNKTKVRFFHLTETQSSNVAAIAYNNGKLYLRFWSDANTVYRYECDPTTLYMLLQAPSLGSFVAKEIRSRAFTKLDVEDLELI